MRRDDNSVYGGNTTGRIGMSFEPMRGPEAACARRHDAFARRPSTTCSFPGYGVPPEPRLRDQARGAAAASRSARAGSRATRGCRRRCTATRSSDLIGYEPDIDENFSPWPVPAGLRLRLRPQHRPRPAAGRDASPARSAGARCELSGNVELLDAKDSDTGERLPRRAAHQESVALDWTDGAWNAGAAFALRRLASRRLAGHDLRARRLRRRSTCAPPGASRRNGGSRRKLLNALDRRVEPVRDYQGLGRQAWIGVRFDGQGL